ncbi:MAG TPA: hypothetical protein VNT81_13795 [Vicinamibacterales bacterium]|nr:hypothetical protein [Vicinamibacterales bacterium]
MKLRDLSLIGALTFSLIPLPAQAQDFKGKLKELIEKSGVYASASTRTSIDNDVVMGPSFGLGYGTAGEKRTGIKFPLSLSGYRADLQTNDGVGFGTVKSRQLLTGIGYQWVFGKMVYGAQLNVGYAFNDVTIDLTAPAVFSSAPPVSIDASNSFVVRPLVKAEYFLHHKVSLRTQLSYTYSDPQVVVTTAQGQFTDEWRPHHVRASIAMGFFPFRKR